MVRVPTDDQGRIQVEAARAAIPGGRPAAGRGPGGQREHRRLRPDRQDRGRLEDHPNAWLHVDGAFGLWAAVSPELRHLVEGVNRADSWSTDAHKWLNVGYDCGFVAVRDPEAHRAAMAMAASYLMRSEQRENWEYVLDSSRRARGFTLYAAIRSLGRSGVQALVERCCALACRIADRLREADGVEVLNEVVLNQVLVRFGDDDERTRAVISAVQADGTAWMGGTTWKGSAAMRISVSNWSTTEADADRTVDAILRCARDAGRLGYNVYTRSPPTPDQSTGRPSSSIQPAASVSCRPATSRPIQARTRSGPRAIVAQSAIIASGASTASPLAAGRKISQTATPAQPASGTACRSSATASTTVGMATIAIGSRATTPMSPAMAPAVTVSASTTRAAATASSEA